jgi:hypothetical protein
VAGAAVVLLLPELSLRRGRNGSDRHGYDSADAL